MVRLGSQEPTFEHIGEYASTDADEAVPIFEDMGARFMPYQKRLLSLYFARDEHGGFAARSICASIPRQNGKSYAARWYCVWMAAHEGHNVLYTCHHGKVARSMFKKICDIVTGDPDLASCLKPNGMGIYKAAGSEGIYFVDENGRDSGCIEFQTRMTSNVRGESYSIICVDEAQEMTFSQAEGLLPTRLAQEDPQILFVGTPPGPQCPGDVFRNIHDRAHAGDTDAWWIEWAAYELPRDGTPKSELLEIAYRTNPAMGTLIREDVMLDTMDAMGMDSIARELFAWWSPIASTVHPIGAHVWEATAIEAIGESYKEKTALAVKFSSDGYMYVLAGCKRASDGRMAFELVEMGTTEAGTRDLASQLAKRSGTASCVVVDGLSGADALCDNLAELKAPKGYVVRPRAGDVIAAATGLLESLSAGKCSHTRQEALDDSALNASKRPVGSRGGWSFGTDGDHDSTAIEAAALAVWACRTSKRNPRRKQKLL